MEGKYRILITDPNGETIVDLSDKCLSRSFQLKRNRAGLIKLSFDIDDLDRYLATINLGVEEVFAVNINEVHVYRRGSHYTAGQIAYVDISLGGTTPKVTVYAVGWSKLFASALTALSQTYTAEDIGAIMWDLIDTFQTQTNADHGVTEGTIQTSRDADRTYELKNIEDALIQLSEVLNAPDFEFTPDKVFNVYYPKKGVRKEGIVFTYPGNIISIGYTEDGSTMANQIIAEGIGTGPERLIATADDTTTRSTYKLRQKRLQFPDISGEDTLQAHADEELRTRVDSLVLPKVVVDGDKDPVLTTYTVGDEVKIAATRYQKLLNPILGWQRIDGIEITVDDTDHEVVVLELARP